MRGGHHSGVAMNAAAGRGAVLDDQQPLARARSALQLPAAAHSCDGAFARRSCADCRAGATDRRPAWPRAEQARRPRSTRRHGLWPRSPPLDAREAKQQLRSFLGRRKARSGGGARGQPRWCRSGALWQSPSRRSRRSVGVAACSRTPEHGAVRAGLFAGSCGVRVRRRGEQLPTPQGESDGL